MTTTYTITGGEGATFNTSGTNTLNTNTATLNGAIRTIDTFGQPGNYEIDLTDNITLTSQLLAINLPAGVTLTINGEGHTIDGNNNQYNGLFVYSGDVTIENLTIANAAAKGGNGGTGDVGGGGGAGLGGGLFVAGATTAQGAGVSPGTKEPGQATVPVVTLINVGFTGDSATGGKGGGNDSSSFAGGGGLEGGPGASPPGGTSSGPAEAAGSG
jgi:hypothetical protein